jgi:hypothetical protein
LSTPQTVGEVNSTTAVAALITGIATLVGGLALVRVAVEWRRLRLIDPRGRTAQLSLATASFAFAVSAAARVSPGSPDSHRSSLATHGE